MSNLSRLLKESWTLLEEQQDKLANYFYARLFLTNPNLRDMFPIHMDVQRSRLLTAIVTAVQTVDDPEALTEYLESLGRDHRKFHVIPSQYDEVGAALVEALRAFGGTQWTLEFDQAWRDAYAVIAQKMIAGADADSHNPPYWHAEVLYHERRSTDIAVITCRPLYPLQYQAGQYVSVECKYQPRLWRQYSVANAPRKDGSMEFHVRAIGAGAIGKGTVTVHGGYTGAVTAKAYGLVKSTITSQKLTGSDHDFDPAKPAVSATAFKTTLVVPAGFAAARVATYATDHAASSDIDLYVYKAGTSTSVGESSGGTADESVDLTEAGSYDVYVVQFAAPGAQDVKVHSFVVGRTALGNVAISPASQPIKPDQDVTFLVSWKDLDPDGRYLGVLEFGDGSAVRATTLLSIGRL